MKDVITGIALILLSLFGIHWLAPNAIEEVGPAPNLAMSPSFWPVVIFYFILVLSVLMTIKAVVVWARNRAAEHESVNYRGMGKVLLAIVLLVPYYYLGLTLGLLIASCIILAVYSILAGERCFKSISAWSIGAPLVLTLFFGKVAQVMVPLGPLKGLF